MNIDNAVNIAKIEAEVDTLCRLSELDLIDKAELDNRLGDAVVKFSDLYDKGGIDSQFCYDIARELSNKIDQADPGEGWWTFNFEEFSRGEKLTSEKVIAESIEKKEINRIRLERDSKAYRVLVRGTKTTPVDDMQPLFGTFESGVEFEIGAGANSISDALKLVKEFDAQNNEKNKECMVDEFERDVGYMTPSQFRVYDSTGTQLLGGMWDHKNKTVHIPDDITPKQASELKEGIKNKEEQYQHESRADNNDTCRRISRDIDADEIKILNSDWSKIPAEENVHSEVSKFNYPVVYWGNDDLEHSKNEGNIYYSLEKAESYYNTVEQAFKGANPDYDVSIYKLNNDKGYLKACDVLLDDEAFNSLSLIKSSQSAAREVSEQKVEKPSDNFSVILDDLSTSHDVVSEVSNSAHTSRIDNTTTPVLADIAQTRQRSSI